MKLRLEAKFLLLGIIVALTGINGLASATDNDTRVSFSSAQPYLMSPSEAESSVDSAEPMKPIQLKVTKFYGNADHQGSATSVVIADQPRTIGGEFDMSRSVNKRLPAEKFPFTLNCKKGTGQPVLTIGNISGINTPEAHQMGQSRAPYVSSPVVIKVNGVRVTYIYENGQNIRLSLPAHVLNREGFNTLQIEAGYYYPEDNRIAYDEIHLDNIAIDF